MALAILLRWEKRCCQMRLQDAFALSEWHHDKWHFQVSNAKKNNNDINNNKINSGWFLPFRAMFKFSQWPIKMKLPWWWEWEPHGKKWSNAVCHLRCHLFLHTFDSQIFTVLSLQTDTVGEGERCEAFSRKGEGSKGKSGKYESNNISEASIDARTHTCNASFFFSTFPKLLSNNVCTFFSDSLCELAPTSSNSCCLRHGEDVAHLLAVCSLQFKSEHSRVFCLMI